MRADDYLVRPWHLRNLSGLRSVTGSRNEKVWSGRVETELEGPRTHDWDRFHCLEQLAESRSATALSR